MRARDSSQRESLTHLVSEAVAVLVAVSLAVRAAKPKVDLVVCTKVEVRIEWSVLPFAVAPREEQVVVVANQAGVAIRVSAYCTSSRAKKLASSLFLV